MATEGNLDLSLGIQDISRPGLTAYLFLIVTLAIVNFLVGLYLTAVTLMSDTRGTVKKCEKLLIYSVVAPDVMVSIYVFTFIGIATRENDWKWRGPVSTWLGFIHTFGIFHPYMAMANICNIITYSVKNFYGYEAISTWKHLTALVLAYASLSISFCSLPATEAEGLVYRPYWFTPMMTVYDGFGGIFMFLSIVGIILAVEGKSLWDLLEIKKLFKQEKVSMKAKADLNTFIAFVGWCLGLNLLLFVCLIEVDNAIAMFILHLPLYTGPAWRVVLLTRRCPHFNFFDKQDQLDLEELALMAVADDPQPTP